VAQRRQHCAFVVVVMVLFAVVVPPASAQQRPDGMRAGEPSAVTETDRIEVDRPTARRLAESDPDLLEREDPTPVSVLIKLDYDAVASYAGDIEDLEATSPSLTGVPLTEDAPARQAYQSFVESREEAVVAEILDAVPVARVERRFRTVYGGVSAVVPADAVREIAELDGVLAVQADVMNELLTDASPSFIGAPTLYDELGGDAEAGAGVIYGNLDSGVWPEHPSLADLGNLAPPDGDPRPCDFGDNPETPEADPFTCQNKLIGGVHATEAYDDVVGDDPYAGTARDSNGHGTHTATTTAGNVVSSAPVLGVERGPVQGVAPGAHVVAYKVCGPQGCLSSDSVAAVEQALADGVTVINYSISGGTSPFTDPVALAFFDAYAAGVFVAASAGNSGPGAGTVNHLAPWVTTVGASTQDRELSTILTLVADDGAELTAVGASLTGGVDEPAPVVLARDAEGYADRLCQEPAPAGTLEGLLVACERGVNARVEKGHNVAQGGAVGMILYNPALADVGADTHWLPTLHIADGRPFLAFMAGASGVTGSFPAGEAVEGDGDVMAAFSSRGPAGRFVKPDVTAPGVQILAGDVPVSLEPASGPPGESFQAIAGTSMSAPHVAGAAVLLGALHPDWSPGQIRSGLMTSATTDVVKEDLVSPADPFDMGAGRIDLRRAGSTPLSFDESPERFVVLGDSPVHAVHLNLPSVNAPVMPGRLTTTRVATNVSGLRQHVTTSASTSGTGSVSVLPRQFALDPNESVTLSITMQSAQTGRQQFGEVQLTSARGDRQHLPVAFVPRQGGVSLSQSCSPRTIPTGGTTTCDVIARNDAFTDTSVSLRTTVEDRFELTGSEGAALVDDRTAELRHVALAGVRPGVPSVEPGDSPGYVPLDDLGVAARPIGDEEIVNLSVPAFAYAGRSWNRIGVVSNGYVVVGGGSSADIECCNLPDGPDPAPPNNVLAPFWTDLDGTGAEGILAADVSDGTRTWIVVEFRLRVFGTEDRRVFQAWIGTDGPEDISYAYASPPTDPNDQPFLVGAENELGQGDMVPELPVGDLRVRSTGARGGDSVRYRVRAEGRTGGVGAVTTSMDTAVVPGVTTVSTDVRVLRPRGDTK
jgi:subtilisin family serine protease